MIFVRKKSEHVYRLQLGAIAHNKPKQSIKMICEFKTFRNERKIMSNNSKQ
jgi:hypothetical protein